MSAAAFGQPLARYTPDAAELGVSPGGFPFVRASLGAEPATLYTDGTRVQVETEVVWRYICGSQGALTPEGLLEDVETARAALADSPGAPSATRGAGGLDIVFNPNGTVPADAVAALAVVEAYIESQFSNDKTVSIDVSFANMNPAVIGVTGNLYVQTPWTQARPALQASMDFDDQIEAYLPGGTVPVRYSPNGPVTAENRVYFTRGNYRVVVGSIAGTVASITLNSQFDFDYDASNGISGGATSFVDVMIHEVGHMLGFVSGIDSRTNDIEVLDLYRFRRGAAEPNNPDSLAAFETTPRLAVFNAPGADQSNSDIITNEYRMSDGNPYQASHFREVGFGTPIGIMDPTLAAGETFFPDYFRASDLNMFDALGYNYPPCDNPTIDAAPDPVTTGCVGETLSLSLNASSDNGPLSYQWRIGETDLLDDPGHISGATTDNLMLTLQPGDAATNYNCVVTTAIGCFTITDDFEIRSGVTPPLNAEPSDAAACLGESLFLSVATPSSFDTVVEWRRGDTVIPADPNRYSAPSGLNIRTFTIFALAAEDVGDDYNVRLTDINSSCSVVTEFFSVSLGEPTITDEPNSITVAAGASAQFNVAAEGAAGYEWRRNTVALVNGGDISGAQSPTLVITNVEASDAGAYDCVVTSAGDCETISQTATLTVGEQQCEADVTGDGQRDLADLAGMLASFGLSVGDPDFNPAADLDDSGVVDLGDLAGLLAVFGVPCP